jgi:menaquinol-cytochrome c reductase iron-sulfur subunit
VNEQDNQNAQSRREEQLSRRKFLGRVTIVAGALAGALVSLPVIGFVFGPLTRRAGEVWQSVGAVDDFTVGETVMVTFPDAAPLAWSGQVGENVAWLQRRGEEEFVAYSHFCTHLGCPVFWLPDAKLFMCPCHGGSFYENGEVAVAPPTEPLVRFPVRLLDGQVEIRTAAVETAG